jgi:hypothetical protein
MSALRFQALESRHSDIGPNQVTAACRPSRSLNRSSSLLESGRQVGCGYRPSRAKGDILCRRPQPGNLSVLGLADRFVQRPAAKILLGLLLLGSSGFAPKRNPAVEILVRI